MSKEQKIKSFLTTPTIRLAAIHLSIIMLLSISFSFIFYNTSTQQFSRPLPEFGQYMPNRENVTGEVFTNRFDSDIRNAIDEYLTQTRQALLARLVWINVVVLFIGAAISYVLARWSLRPIETALDAQSQFVSDASHELRTPLTVLQTTNEVALRKSKLSAVEARKLIKHNVEEVKKLKDLSNTLLDLLKNTAESVSLKPVDLQIVVSEAMSPVVTIAQQKNIAIEDKVPKLYVYTNQKLLAQIISILLDNAVKYSDDNSKILITAAKTNKKVMLNVIDKGIGIRASDMQLIFNRFYRADKSRSSLKETHGYGLGLSIAKKIAERLGAKITVSSTLGKGSTFTVELPIDELQ